jgi:hypothetical protein
MFNDARWPHYFDVTAVTDFKKTCLPEISIDLALARVYKLSELVLMPEGTLFHHAPLGRCWIKHNEGKTIMVFETGEEAVINKEYPFNKPMKLLFCENLDYKIPF